MGILVWSGEVHISSTLWAIAARGLRLSAVHADVTWPCYRGIVNEYGLQPPGWTLNSTPRTRSAHNLQTPSHMSRWGSKFRRPPFGSLILLM